MRRMLVLLGAILSATLGWAATIDPAAYGFSPEAAPEVNAAALQKAMDGGKRTVSVTKPGVYRLDRTILLDDETEFVCAPGVVLSKAKRYSNVLANRGAYGPFRNHDITLKGVEIRVNGFETIPGCDSPAFGLRGQVGFYGIDKLTIRDITLTDFNVSQYAVQVVDFDGLLIDGFVLRGNKDGIHLNCGRNFIIRNGKLRTYDDGIALNAGEWPGDCTPRMGSVTDGLIENVEDEPGGHCNFARVITGAWMDWKPGMRLQYRDIFTVGKEVYAVYPGQRTTNETVSLTCPTHRKGVWKSPEGINFCHLQSDGVRQVDVRRVTFRNIRMNCQRSVYCAWEISEWARLLHPDLPRENYPVIDIRLENVVKTAPGTLVSGTADANIVFTNCRAEKGPLVQMNWKRPATKCPVRRLTVDGRTMVFDKGEAHVESAPPPAPRAPVADCDLKRGSRALWGAKALDRTPRTYPVTLPCANDYGRIEGVEPIFIEGEPWRGWPTRVFAWWGLPKGATAAQKVPAMVLVHGGGGTAFAKWVKTWNDRGYAAIAMDTCGAMPQGERDGKPHPRHPWSGPSGWGSSVAQIDEPLRDQWTYHAVAAVMRCHSFLRSLPAVDRDRIGLTGISWGGYLSSIVGSVDDRFRFAAPVYGCGYYDRNREWYHMNGDGEKLRAWFALWDPKNFYDSPAGGAKIPYLWCCGTNDRFYPLDTVRMSCNLLDPAVPLNLSLKYKMPHGHPPSGDPREIAAYADFFLKGGKPLVAIGRAWLAKDTLRAEFDAHGRKAVGAELLYTESTNEVLMAREWRIEKVADFDAGGRLSAPVSPKAVMFFVNVLTDDGLVASSRIFQREEWGLVDNPRNPATEWMAGGCGAFAHYLLDKETFPRVGEFDVPALTKQIVDMKPDWFCFTLGQNSGYVCSPNATYERLCGYEPGSHCSRRDLPAEIIAALKPHGVKFMLYLPCQPPNRDARAETAFGFPATPANADRPFNLAAARKWAAVIEEWSRRYGKDVAGWWFDGGYRWLRFDDEIATLYAAAVKRGNPDAVVAFNPGAQWPMRRWTPAGDYLAGEINEPLKVTCAGRWADDRQWQLLTFAGSSWARRDCRFTDAQWIDWMRPILKNGGAVTLDLAIDRPTGKLDPAQAAQLKRVFAAARERK